MCEAALDLSSVWPIIAVSARLHCCSSAAAPFTPVSVTCGPRPNTVWQPGSFSVSLTATDSARCATPGVSAPLVVAVRPRPVATASGLASWTVCQSAANLTLGFSVAAGSVGEVVRVNVSASVAGVTCTVARTSGASRLAAAAGGAAAEGRIGSTPSMLCLYPGLALCCSLRQPTDDVSLHPAVFASLLPPTHPIPYSPTHSLERPRPAS